MRLHSTSSLAFAPEFVNEGFPFRVDGSKAFRGTCIAGVWEIVHLSLFDQVYGNGEFIIVLI